MSSVSSNWVRKVNQAYSPETMSRVYAYMREEFRMSTVPSKVLKSTELHYESLLKRFQSYAFGGKETKTASGYQRVARSYSSDDALLELKRNVRTLDELNSRLEFLMGEINSTIPRG